MKTIVGLYDNVTAAQQVVQALTDATFERDRISLVLNDHEGAYGTRLDGDTTVTDVSDDIGTGIATGAAVGGLGGLLIGLSALAIPGIGPVVAAGPLLTGLVGASVGAAVGGLVGALANAGVPEEQAGYYAEGVRRGAALVAIETADEDADEVADIMNRYHPVNIEERARGWRQSGWIGKNDETAFIDPVERNRAYPSIQDQSNANSDRSSLPNRTWDSLQDQSNAQPDWLRQGFRTHYQTNYLNWGRPYEDYDPAYQYGYTLVNDTGYRDRDWNSIEGEVRRDWSQKYPNRRWEEFKDAVYYGWQQVKHAVTA